MRRAWWRTRAEAVRATRPALTPPAGDEGEEKSRARLLSSEQQPSNVLHVEISEPNMGNYSLVDLHSTRCPDCNVLAAGTLVIIASEEEGWCVGTVCGCQHPFFTRESGWYSSVDEAQQALESGTYMETE